MNVLCHAGRFGRKYFVYQTTNCKANQERNITNVSCGICARNSVQTILPLYLPSKDPKIAKK
jgi:ribosomal protein L37AE/L43A